MDKLYFARDRYWHSTLAFTSISKDINSKRNNNKSNSNRNSNDNVNDGNNKNDDTDTYKVYN